MSNIITYVKDSFTELKNHVTWTPLNELQNSTAIVLAGLFIITVLLWIMDKISQIGIVQGIYGNL